jgi:hypothetical protein
MIAIKPQPSWSVQPGGRSTGNKGHQFIITALTLTKEPCGLPG